VRIVQVDDLALHGARAEARSIIWSEGSGALAARKQTRWAGGSSIDGRHAGLAGAGVEAHGRGDLGWHVGEGRLVLAMGEDEAGFAAQMNGA
jgi:hypothetical protein